MECTEAPQLRGLVDDLTGARQRKAAEADILRGLSAQPKTVSPKFFYDEVGSQLFERICELDEYYPTRTELGILRDHQKEIAEYFTRDSALIELGSGASLKTRVLLDRAPEISAYVPVDISREILMSSAAALRTRYPALCVQPLCADYTRGFRLPESVQRAERKILFFPGSTVGNFDPPDAERFLRMLAGLAQNGNSLLLIGVDLVKDRGTLERAYNDAEGVTANFNLNLLTRLNAEFGANFDVANFEHHAVFNRARSRIEMHLRARRAQEVRLLNQTIPFVAGESIHTESSYKYSVEGFRTLADAAGWRPLEVWTDARNLFSVQLFATRPGGAMTGPRLAKEEL